MTFYHARTGRNDRIQPGRPVHGRGWSPPYSWSIIDPNLGSLSNSDKSAVNYTRKGGAVGQNIVELKDSS